MLTNKRTRKVGAARAFDRSMLRGAVVSLVWAVISDRRKKSELTLQHIAEQLDIDKSNVSRWFGSRPNWTLNTIADIAGVLDLDLNIVACDRRTGTVYTQSGRSQAARTSGTEGNVMVLFPRGGCEIQTSSPPANVLAINAVSPIIRVDYAA